MAGRPAAREHPEGPPEERPTWPLWAPPAAWFVALVSDYAVVPWACGSAMGTLALHAIALAALAIAVAGALSARRSWLRMGGGRPGELAAPVERSRFLAGVAISSASLFALVLLVQWLAIVVLDPCRPGPRGPFAPDL